LVDHPVVEFPGFFVSFAPFADKVSAQVFFKGFKKDFVRNHFYSGFKLKQSCGGAMCGEIPEFGDTNYLTALGSPIACSVSTGKYFCLLAEFNLLSRYLLSTSTEGAS